MAVPTPSRIAQAAQGRKLSAAAMPASAMAWSSMPPVMRGLRPSRSDRGPVRSWPRPHTAGYSAASRLTWPTDPEVDGGECDWGRVLAWEPPHRLVVTWQINGQWQYDPDPAHASEIEVRFTADGPEQTIVELEHRHLERLVDGQALRDGITGGGGWAGLLELFAKAAANQP
jgi:uncharacterized protein YndB with AHSA1/START domain